MFLLSFLLFFVVIFFLWDLIICCFVCVYVCVASYSIVRSEVSVRLCLRRLQCQEVTVSGGTVSGGYGVRG